MPWSTQPQSGAIRAAASEQVIAQSVETLQGEVRKRPEKVDLPCLADVIRDRARARLCFVQRERRTKLLRVFVGYEDGSRFLGCASGGVHTSPCGDTPETQTRGCSSSSGGGSQVPVSAPVPSGPSTACSGLYWLP